MKRAAAAVLAAAALAGCMTSTVSRKAEGSPGDGGAEHVLAVDVENTGWYLLDFIPVLCGDPHGVNRISTVLFRDTLTLQNNLDELMRIVDREPECRIGTVVSHEESENLWVFIVTRHGYHTSATLLKKQAEPEPPGSGGGE